MYFTLERVKRIVRELKDYCYPSREPIMSYKIKPGDIQGLTELNTDSFHPDSLHLASLHPDSLHFASSGWQDFGPEDRWGGRDRHYWFRTEVSVPERFDGRTVVYEVKTGREGDWDALNPQFLLYINGQLVQALDVNHREAILAENAKAGEVFSIALHAYSGMKEGLVELKSDLAVLDREVEKLYYNIKVPLEVAELIEPETKTRIDILNYLNDAVNLLDLRKPGSQAFMDSVTTANQFLEREFYEKYCGSEEVTAVCIGHTHIDVAWLWTIAQTREKAARSFSTVLQLMREYPEYVFISSQPQLYKFVKEDHPEVYQEIKERIREGRWEAEGAMWLEADCNLASGESLVRQVLFGTRFFEREFGVKNKILWLPDVFGYSAALPQILKKSGIDYFMTTKISWNEYNKIPYDTFKWRGIDGTEVLTHFVTTQDAGMSSKSHTTTYNGNLVPTQVIGAWQRYQQKDLGSEVLISYGYGDGGGGATKEMLENARRMSRGIPGCPKVKLAKAGEFFGKLAQTVAGKKRLPTWVGELYLEYHRGTYTSMARNKRYNRKSEFLYQDAELLAVIAKVAAGAREYPQDQLNRGWETILLNQFHDILPGSSIKEVYEDSQQAYLKILDEGKAVVDQALTNITEKIKLAGRSAVVFNPSGFYRSDLVEIDLPAPYNAAEIRDSRGKLMQTQISEAESGDGQLRKKVLFYAEDVPAKGYKAFQVNFMTGEAQPVLENGANGLRVSAVALENRYFSVRLDGDCNIVSLYDKQNQREVLQPGQKANLLLAFEDKPHNFDAWDINIYYQEKFWEIQGVESVAVTESGPLRATLRVTRRFLDSTLTQSIRIYSAIPRLDFVNRIDWREKQILVKTAFPVDIHADKATYEIQYGNLERPTHWNTSWDYARFEVCAHKWADLSEDGYGVSLLNDCKYGHDIKDGVMRLTLLKSAVEPNTDADREVHRFTYSLFPHAGSWKQAGTVEMAYALNCSMYVKMAEAHPGELPSEFSLAGVDQPNVIMEVVKKAEDSDDLIIRMYECHNRRTSVKLDSFYELTGVWECDLMENELGPVNFDKTSFRFEIKPYEIKTFKLRLK
ncbi:MAG TPA: alpha-mannosidase [Bacillota bacterium]|nr:alpha-mannosidase [Bacillota bacterium]